MKKSVTVIVASIIVLILSCFFINKSYAVETGKETVIANETESKLVQLKESELKSLDDYKVKYGSDSYGFTAYILHKVQIYSIPFCFLGIMIGAIYNYVLGIRHLEIAEKGLGLMVLFVTLAIICQVLPLVFTIVVKFGRE